MYEINRLEKDSILYYQGGGANIELSPANESLREFYNIQNSYIVINALLMPGISNESVRLKEERKKVNISIFKHMDELLKVYCRLYSAMCKYTYLYKHGDRCYTYRVDRMNTLNFLRYGQMYSFMSTKKYKDSDDDFNSKAGILLLEVTAQGNIECVDVNAVLEEESLYPREQEILFAPFVLLDKDPIEMTEEEKLYRDIHNNPPMAKYLLHLRASSIAPCKIDEKEITVLYQEVTIRDSMSTVRQVWEKLMEGEELEINLVQRYARWKEKLQTYLRMCFSGIKYEVLLYDLNTDEMCRTSQTQNLDKGQDEGMGVDGNQDVGDTWKFQKRLSKLEKDIDNYYKYTDEKRREYKCYVQSVNVIVSVLYPLTALFIALSMVDNLQILMQILGVISSAIGAIIPLIAKGFAWNEKLQQRTNTYMMLDRLMRDMSYDNSLDEERLEKYIEYYKEIIDEDNRRGLANVLIMGTHSENLVKKSEKKEDK